MDDSEYIQLLLIPDTEHVSPNKAIRFLGTLIDAADDRNDLLGLGKALRLAESLEDQKLTSAQRLLLFYFVSNVWASIHSINHQNQPSAWDWEQPEAEMQIIYLRRAIREEAFNKAHKARRCQIYTNLANILNNVGRSVEAIETWSEATTLVPTFGMAQGNLGKGIGFYAHTIYDKNNFHDSMIVFKAALLMLRSAVNLEDIYPSAREDFRISLQRLEAINEQVRFEHHSEIPKAFGDSELETDYRKWVLRNRLFINFLNEVDLKTAQGAADKAVLPALTRPITKRSTHFEGLFNQMKQEFVSARFLYFEGIEAENVHFADKGVNLYDTLDFPSYSIAVEKIKIAFRLTYSILDKMAFFLNEYLNLGIKHKAVSFKTFWYEKQKRERGLRSEFINRNNWALRGLFWLSKDLFEESEAFKESLAPDATELAEIRNHLEHKYLKVHEYGIPEGLFAQGDTLAYSIGRDDLASKTLRIMKLARSAMIYLILAITIEEREKEKRSQGKIATLEVDLVDDEFKF